jgi:hypothetical protein
LEYDLPIKIVVISVKTDCHYCQSCKFPKRNPGSIFIQIGLDGDAAMTRPKVTGRDTGPQLAFSIEEFCKNHGVSRGTYYNLRKAGLAPTEMRVFSRHLISTEAAAEWRRKREIDSPTDA